MDSKTPKEKILKIYTQCCSWIRRMPSIEAKKFIIRTSIDIYSLLDEDFLIEPKRQAQLIDHSIQTQVELEIKKQVKLPISQVSLKSKNQSSLCIPEKDEVLDQAIQKYQNLIQSLYSQIEDMQQEHAFEIQKMNKQHEQKMRQSNRNENLIQTRCESPVEELMKQISRLEKQVRKRDKMLIKKIKI